jgi:hypothetical protein
VWTAKRRGACAVTDDDPVPGDALAGSWDLTLLSARHILFPTATKRKDPAAVSLVRRAGKARLKKITTERRSGVARIAAMAGRAKK